MDLALPAQRHLVQFGVLLEMQRGIFLAQLGDGRGQLDLVLAVGGLDAERIDRHKLLDLELRQLAHPWRPASRSPVAMPSSRPSPTVSPACASASLVCSAPLSAKTPPTRASRADPRYSSTAPSFSVPLSTRAEADLAAMGGVIGLQDLDHRLAAVRQAEPRGRGAHFGHFMAQRLQQPADAIVVLGRADQHRHHLAVRQFLGQIGEHFVARRLDVGEQFFHQMLVEIGELLQHLEKRASFSRALTSPCISMRSEGACGAIDIGALQRQIDEARHRARLPDRNLAQQQRLVGRLLQEGEQIAQRRRRPCRSC